MELPGLAERNGKAMDSIKSKLPFAPSKHELWTLVVLGCNWLALIAARLLVHLAEERLSQFCTELPIITRFGMAIVLSPVYSLTPIVLGMIGLIMNRRLSRSEVQSASVCRVIALACSMVTITIILCALTIWQIALTI